MRTGIKIYLNNKKTKEEKSRMKKLLLIPVILLLAATHVFAQNFPMGEETKGFKVKVSDETDISFRVRLQPRIDMGDLIKSEDGKSYESEMDMYLKTDPPEIHIHFRFIGFPIFTLYQVPHIYPWLQTDPETDVCFIAYLYLKSLSLFTHWKILGKYVCCRQ